MKKLNELHGDEATFSFIVGSDLLPTLHLWHEGQKLLNEVDFVVYNRQGYDLEPLKSSNTFTMPTNYTHSPASDQLFGMVSSTEVRRRVREARAQEDKSVAVEMGLGVAGMVTKGVIEYIKEHALY